MLTIAKLFGKSPFIHLQNHMHKVSDCMKKLEEVLDYFLETENEKIEQSVPQLSKLEHEADLCKNDIRNHLPKSIFLPIDRSQFLEILSLQDTLADITEDIGNLLILKPLESYPESMKEPFKLLAKKNLEAFWEVKKIIQEMKELIESSFGGKEAAKVKEMIDHTSYIEYESDILKRATLKAFFNIAEEIPFPAFYLWTHLIEQVGAISHISEKLATRIRLLLET